MRNRLLHLPLFILTAFFVTIAAVAQSRPVQPVKIDAGLHAPFRFVAYGDTRFTDPANTKDANPEVRLQLVRAIADARPAFISFGGDIPLTGESRDDWKVYDQETAIWRERKITVYPAIGNHELKGDANIALENYFARFPYLKQNRFYSVRAANNFIVLSGQ